MEKKDRQLDYHREIDAAAREAVQAACRILQNHFFRPDRLDVARKGPDDFVSRADFEAERGISDVLHEWFPAIGILGEEQGRSGSVGARTWVIDFLDGTANFIRGIPHFAVSIALMTGSQVEYGLVCHPLLEEWFTAGRGRANRRFFRPAAWAVSLISRGR